MLTPEEVQQYRQSYNIGSTKKTAKASTTPSDRIAKLRQVASGQKEEVKPMTEEVQEPVESAPVDRFTTNEDDGLLERGAKGLGNIGIKAGEILGIDKFGKGIGQALFQLTPEAKELQKQLEEGKITPEEYESIATGGVTNKEVIGGALRTGAAVLSGSAGNIFSPAKSFLGSVGKGAVEAGIGGAGFGAVSGLATGLEKDMSATETAKQVGKEAVIAGAVSAPLGAILGPVGYGVGNYFARRKELQSLLQTGAIDDARLAGMKKTTDIVTGKEKLVKDPVGSEAVRQGFDPADIALIKTSKPQDKTLMQQMHQVATDASTKRRSLTRPLDLVGEAILKPVKGISENLKVKGKELDTVAERLVGQPVEMLEDLTMNIDDSLARAGVSISEDLATAGPASEKVVGQKLNFAGSDFEGVGGTEKIVNNVYNRLTSAKDAHDLHRLKRYIDSSVEYGKTGEGLPGQAERLLKDWRRQIDQVLDTEFPDYKFANDEVAKLIETLDTFGEAIGRKFSVNDPMANVRVGQVTSRLLSNSPNRGEILNAIVQMQKTARASGIDTPDDILALVRYADMLEDVFGTQATRSFLGLSQRATGANIAGDIVEQGVGRTLVEKGAQAVREASGVNKENAKKTLLDLVRGGGSSAPSTLDKLRKLNADGSVGLSIKPTVNPKQIAQNMDAQDFVRLEMYSEMLDSGVKISPKLGMKMDELLESMGVDTLRREGTKELLHDILAEKEKLSTKVPVTSVE